MSEFNSSVFSNDGITTVNYEILKLTEIEISTLNNTLTRINIKLLNT